MKNLQTLAAELATDKMQLLVANDMLNVLGGKGRSRKGSRKGSRKRSRKGSRKRSHGYGGGYGGGYGCGCICR